VVGSVRIREALLAQTAKERRKQSRVPLRLPVRAQGRSPDGTPWEEMTTTVDAATGGLGLLLQHPCRIGQCLHLALPLPKRFRSYDVMDQSYRVYVIVRDLWGSVPPRRVGVMYLGRHPPRGASDPLPSELFLMPGEAPEDRRDFARHAVRLSLTVETPYAPGGTKREETQPENLSKWGALVETRLPVAKGDTVLVAECGGSFKTRAEIRNVTIGADGHPRLSLLFLDEPAPARLLPPPEPEAP
jgi:hypothetical protein